MSTLANSTRRRRTNSQERWRCLRGGLTNAARTWSRGPLATCSQWRLRLWLPSSTRVTVVATVTVAVMVVVMVAVEASAQMVTTGTGLQTNGHRFGEQFQLGWTYRDRGLTATFGGGVPVPFGNTAGNPGFTTGLQTGPLSLGLSAGQFTSLQSSSTTGMLTTTNGYPGSLFIGTTRPFVTGMVPIVGGGGGFQNLGPANTVAGRVARGELALSPTGKLTTSPIAADRIELPPAPADHPADPQRPMAAPSLPGQSAASASSMPSGPRSALRQEPSSATQLIARGDAALAANKPEVARALWQLAAARTSDPASIIAQQRLAKLAERR